MGRVLISPGKLPSGTVRAVPALAGFTAVVGQAVLLREIIVLFSGNEISLGIALAAWLIWTATGSALASRSMWDRVPPRAAVAILECLSGIALAPTIWLLHWGRAAFQATPGELLGPLPMLVTALAALSVFCSLSGAMFVAAARLIREQSTVSSSAAAGRVYLLEALGSGLGGIISSLLFLYSVGPFSIAILIAALNVVTASIVFRITRWKAVCALLISLLAGIPVSLGVGPMLDRAALAHVWQGFEVVSSRNTIYGNLVIVRTGDLLTVYSNGEKLATTSDDAAAEEAVHYGLLEHPAPATVLLIGGSIGDAVNQVLEHPSVRRIDVLELDPALLEIARQITPDRTAATLSDPRVRIHVADARLWLKTTRDRFDVILLNLPDPATAQLNRFYTEEFFRSARNHLAPGGILSFQVRSSEETISPDLAAFLRCMASTARSVFRYVIIIPGETAHFFATNQPNLLTEDPRLLIARLRERNLATRYVREYSIPFRMTPDRMEQAHAILQPPPGTPVNRDLRPIAYYFDVVLWSAQFHSAFARTFAAAAHIPFTTILAGTIFFLVCFVASIRFRRPFSTGSSTALACAGISGYTSMALEIILLLSFQSVYGVVYQQLALLIGMFLAGMGLGSWFGLRRIAAARAPLMLSVARVQFVLSASAPALLLAVTLLARWPDTAIILAAAQAVFPLLALMCGLPGGYVFPLITEIRLKGRSTPAGAGAVYALDLLGGAVGALLLSGYCIPVFGFWNTAWLTAAVSLAPAFLAVWTLKSHPAAHLAASGSR
ncbi:fused MFS/spermidine synthase [Occallatibacter riparius]|uniref:Polyamine aminopropyltransferase n=1 Tax=Occallatibacter riparius TaxID=1002689 RepID=A0A9J7BM89_9BACT|nr:fused MFS/spermidine synthase [Occallatibacter riparius]UWZ83609.1 fused MFS/spermidine synthase [Occallatibacter riparius]